jgi:hypothetical protein
MHADELIILGHKLQAIRDSFNRNLDALAAEIAAKIPPERTLKSNRPDPADAIKKLIRKRKFKVVNRV